MSTKFKEFAEKVKDNFSQLQKQGKLFKSSLTGHDLWDIYIGNFSPEDNPIFRDPESSSHNCNLDKSFIRRYGNIVAVDENFNIITMWDGIEEGAYASSCKAISTKLKNTPIGDVFFETFDELNNLPYERCTKSQSSFRLGIDENHKIYTQDEADKFGVVRAGEVYKFYHFYGDLDKSFVDTSGKSQASILSDYRANKEVFKRGLDEIPLDTLALVRDLINQGSLLDGQTHLYKIEQIIPFKKEYDTLSPKQKDNWAWVTSFKLAFAKFKNELIGVLCSELAEGMELNVACQTWNKRVDPANYMKATAPITANQIKDAQSFVEDNGYSESFERRFATIDDINVDEILHSNIGEGKLKNASVFDKVKATTPSTRHKRSQFDDIEEVSIEKFMTDILPTCTSVEAFLENRMEGNLVALTTANVTDSKKMFKWNNNFSWTYKGNLAGKSQLKEAVKSRGGNVEGVMRVSLAFPNTTDDYDLHLYEPNRGSHIFYGNVRQTQLSSGVLDLDAQGIDGHQPAEKRVENIIYTSKSKMPKGTYQVEVNNYSGRGIHTSFLLEIEIEGEVTILQLKDKLNNNTVKVASINFDGKDFTINPSSNMEILESKTISKEIWNLETNQFHKVNLVCLSPNHWGDNNVGNKHYLFMVENCKSDSSLRAFHNENLNSDLLQHKKVMEVLGATTMLEPSDKQLCGLGFNATVKDELILKLAGTFKRTIKIKF